MKPADTKGKDKVLGLTIVQFDKDTGEIRGADMEINTQGMTAASDDGIAFRDPTREEENDPVPRDAYDFLSIVTHEAGHFLGIAHSSVETSTMYWSANPGNTFQRILSPDDVNAVCTIYRPDGNRSVVVNGKEEKAAKGVGCNPTPTGGFSRECEDNACNVNGTVGRSPSSPALGCAFAAIGALAIGRRVRRRKSDASNPANIVGLFVFWTPVITSPCFVSAKSAHIVGRTWRVPFAADTLNRL